jgi:hypothetical protein
MSSANFCWLAHEPIHARRVRTWEQVWKWTRRKPAVASLGLAVVLLFVMGFFGVLGQWRRADYNAGEEVRQRRLAEGRELMGRQILYAAGLCQDRPGKFPVTFLQFSVGKE